MRNWGNSRELRRLRANGRTKEFFDAPIRVICVIRGYFPGFYHVVTFAACKSY